MADDYLFDLDDILEDAAESDLQDVGFQEEEALETLPYLRFIQKSTSLPKVTVIPKTVALGRENAEGAWEGFFFKSGSLKFWMVRPLVEIDYIGRKGPAYIGGRTMWKWDALGQRVLDSGPACKSLDGKTPLSQFIARDYVLPPGHFAAGHTSRIGFLPAVDEATGEKWYEPIAPEKMCKECLFAQWPPRGAEGRPMCAKSYSFVIFIPPQMALRPTYSDDPTQAVEAAEYPGGMAILQGSSPSVQLAITGRDAGQSGGALDGGVLPGLMTFLGSLGSVLHTVSIADLKPAHMRYIVNIIPKKGDPYPNEGEVLDKYELAKIAKAVEIQVPLYPYAREGLPEQVGNLAFGGLRYLTFDLIPNAWQQNPTVPRFGIHKDKVDPEHYGLFYAARKNFENEEMYDQLLLSGNTERVQEAVGYLTSGATEASQLPPPEDSFDEIEDL